MDLLKALILVCAVDIAPADCNSDSARVVLAGPEVRSNGMCGMNAQAYLAQTAIGREKTDEEYLKVICTRRQKAERMLGARNKAPDATE